MMYKKLMILLPFLSCIFLLTGCGESEEYDYSYKGLPGTEAGAFDETLNNTEYDAGSSEDFSNKIDNSAETSSADYSVNAYTTIEKAEKAIGYNFSTPSTLPTGYHLDEISVVLNGTDSFAQTNYKNGDFDITYRVSASTDKLNSDRTKYDNEKEITVLRKTVTCLCKKDIIYVATWQEDGYYYCIMSSAGLDTTTMSTIIASCK